MKEKKLREEKEKERFQREEKRESEEYDMIIERQSIRPKEILVIKEKEDDNLMENTDIDHTIAESEDIVNIDENSVKIVKEEVKLELENKNDEVEDDDMFGHMKDSTNSHATAHQYQNVR